MASVIKRLPKVELHAHLNGSLSDATLNYLIEKAKSAGKIHPNTEEFTIKESRKTLEECFHIFKIIHRLTQDLDVVGLITSNVIREFHDDNVFYLELRTTPKAIHDSYTKEEYILKVISAIQESEASLGITVKLLPSLDRGRGLEDAFDTFHYIKRILQHEIYGKYICGVDISGNPSVGNLKDYIPILQEAKKMGLKLAVHLLEVNSEIAFEEAEALLQRNLVDRIGHGTYVHPSVGGRENIYKIVREKKIPLEICLSSNVKGGVVEKIENHHVKYWMKDHLIAICTDDKGVFSTSLTEELALFEKIFSPALDMKDLTDCTLSFSFLDEETKAILKKKYLK